MMKLNYMYLIYRNNSGMKIFIEELFLLLLNLSFYALYILFGL